MNKFLFHFSFVFLSSISASYAALPAPAQRAHLPQKLSFKLVSAGNCEQTAQVTLTNCHFPRIEVRELYPNLPTVPFRTRIKVRTSLGCQLQGPVGFLQVRLGEYGIFPPGQTNFLSGGQFSIHHTRQEEFRHDAFLPLGQLSVFPKSSAIFLQAEFPQHCTVSLDVYLNEIAIRSPGEASGFLGALSSKLEDLKRLEAFFQFLHVRVQAQRAHGAVESLLRVQESGVAGLRAEWETLRQSLLETPEHPACEGIPLFQEFLTEHEQSLRAVRDSIRSLCFEEILARDPGSRAHSVFDLNAFEAVQLKVRKAEQDVRSAQEFLRSLDLEAIYEQTCRQDLGQIFSQEICEPHGLVDRIRHALGQIGRR